MNTIKHILHPVHHNINTIHIHNMRYAGPFLYHNILGPYHTKAGNTVKYYVYEGSSGSSLHHSERQGGGGTVREMFLLRNLVVHALFIFAK